MTMRWLAVALMLGCISCEANIHGAGMLYVYNGTQGPVSVEVNGPTTSSLSLEPRSGEMIEKIVAGAYQVVIKKGGAEAPETISTEVVRERLTVINVAGAACFARTDVAGMYRKDRRPVVRLQVYSGASAFQVPELIDVLPDQVLPKHRSKGPYAFQRLSVVPCSIIKDDMKVEDFVHREP
jgi:hypothetical protein